MPRKKGDGRGRLGGRAPGTPNRDKPLKAFLRQHSVGYFIPSVEETDESGNATGRMLSQFDADCAALLPGDRADIELKLLRFHTPQMQATSVDMTLSDTGMSVSERLARLAGGEDIESPGDGE